MNNPTRSEQPTAGSTLKRESKRLRVLATESRAAAGSGTRLDGAWQVRVLQERRHPETDGRAVLAGLVGEARRPVEVVGGARVRVVHPVGAGRGARLVHVPPILVAEALHLRVHGCPTAS